ncbi:MULTISPECIES: IclR family transcriptional regulator domain-containing protein [Bordetella]|uniref:IclR family transcriptional regulator n=1 Tax=Bordetella genomosp. 6 TaxID=463024 RepID=A0ABX4FCH6_9BORD|nr:MULTISPECIES: IclR family transcriptional regulator C-terminal domain-containing protein [Bordetella]AOB26232.1 IclR family transcriptional regulator [Bordetella bronchiseptica]AZW43526.1 IclR family transcriptional regulator [Bordetella bronchiseptica]KCV61809.1 transcriptional regulator, IclR family, C-terminal domain protein [Bordetella bronchiseptica 99-R-0433]MBN3268958.1 IclR family transcriptional regulator [Bordetella bronchiseptica]OZI75320.1 IclR family transcriptional regulator [
MAESRQEDYFINGLAKGLAIIQAFNNEARALTLAEAAYRTGLSRAAARRVLLTLVELGFAARCGDRHFALTPRVLSLGYAYLSSMPLWRFAEPVLEALVEELRQTCSIAALDGSELVYVARIPLHRTLSQGLSIGSRIPLYCHSAGRVLLSGFTPEQLESYLQAAELRPLTARTVTERAALRDIIQEVRRRGYAWSCGEVEDHTTGLSVPIFQHGRLIAALNVSRMHSADDESLWCGSYLQSLRRAAGRLTAALSVDHSPRIVRMERSPACPATLPATGGEPCLPAKP